MNFEKSLIDELIENLKTNPYFYVGMTVEYICCNLPTYIEGMDKIIDGGKSLDRMLNIAQENMDPAIYSTCRLLETEVREFLLQNADMIKRISSHIALARMALPKDCIDKENLDKMAAYTDKVRDSNPGA